MIAQLTGKLVYREPTYVILDIGGVGYALHISLHTYAQIKTLEHCTLLSAMHVKSEVFTLYGFYTGEEKAWWLRLIGVSGIGPKTALTMLSSLTPTELHNAILDKQERLFATIKGIGLKVARRIILELADQAKQLHEAGDGRSIVPPSETSKVDQDAMVALVALGLTPKMAQKAVETVRAKASSSLTLEELIKRSLQSA